MNDMFRIFMGALAMTAWQCAAGSLVTEAEMNDARSWVSAKFAGKAEAAAPEPELLPDSFFSFVYGGKAFAEIRGDWKLERKIRKLDDCRTEHVLTYTDPETGLVVRCVGIEYLDFPTVEWTLHFKNTGDTDTPILENIQALDIELGRPPKGERWYEPEDKEFRLHHYVGGECSPRAYQPLMTALRPRTQMRFTGSSGCPTQKEMPYFNLQRPGDAGGLIVVVGWPGQWAAEFARDGDTRLHIRAGQERTHFKLLPGEEVRTPLVVLQFWQGDHIDSQNVWRRWMVAHNLPRPGGKLPSLQLAAASSVQFHEMQNATTENQNLFIDRYLEEGIKLDYWWMDAGWYVCGEPPKWGTVGTWEVDTKRFPNGLREISDHAHRKGVQTIVWFEPERVSPDTWLATHHPEWVLGGEKGGLLNLGDPEAWNWLVEHIDRMIVEQGVDLYRQDFNTSPLGKWRANDTEDRQGITEIKYVTGYLAYWDELCRRHPDMLIDTCAGGGRRNDLETLRRAVPLHRSDYDGGPTGQQCQTYGLSFWVPYHARSLRKGWYGMRSRMMQHVRLIEDVRRTDVDYAEIRTFLDQWRQVAPCFYGDYYPLTGFSLEEDAWMAWQFDRPDLGEGLVQVFRREASPFESARFKLHGLEPDATYTIVNFDIPGETGMSGKELMENGLPVTITTSSTAVVITYKKHQ